MERGWYPDPAGRRRLRLWDGTRWTIHYAKTPSRIDDWLDKSSTSDDRRRAVANKHIGLAFAIAATAATVVVAPFVFMAMLMHGIGEGIQRAFEPTGKGVTVTACGPDPNGNVAVGGTASNTTEKRSFYFIDLTVHDELGNRLADVFVTPPGVGAHETAPWLTKTPARFAPGVTCDLSAVAVLPVP